MRYWGPNIEIDGSYYKTAMAKSKGLWPGEDNIERYETTVQDLLRTLETKSTVGKTIIQAISRSPKKLRIIPLTITERYGPTSRGTWPTPVKDAAASPKSFQVCYVGLPCYTGSGGGSDIILNFEPYSWNGFDTMIGHDPGQDQEPDDVLLHELVHCLRMMRGQFAKYTIAGPFVDSEELLAVMIRNMYVAQVGRVKSLQAQYGPLVFQAMKGSWFNTVADFYHDHEKVIEQFVREMPDICNSFGAMVGFWNPFRARAVNKANPLP
jgi:Effector protein